MTLPSKVRIVEVGPRDGLQNEPRIVPTAIKVELIDRLAACGLTTIEAAAFVSPKWVPQMADSAEVMRGLKRRDGVAYPVLVPNMKGFEAALAAGAREIAVFGAASEAFSRKNINCSIAESLDRFRPVVAAAQAGEREGARLRLVRAWLPVPGRGGSPARWPRLPAALLEMGCYEISLGDTIGVGTPGADARP